MNKQQHVQMLPNNNKTTINLQLNNHNNNLLQLDHLMILSHNNLNNNLNNNSNSR